MAKKHQQRPAREAAGRNNPEKSTVITTGPYKKPETYQEQAALHENPEKQAQASRVHPERDPHPGQTHKSDSQARLEDRESRSGTESNAGNPRKAARVHESAQGKQPAAHPEGVNYSYDLQVAQRPAGDLGLGEAEVPGDTLSAMDIKELHTKLADLTDDELKQIQILPVGTRLEQGSRYIDLQHLEQGDFVATASMVSGSNNLYVAKKDAPYVLWNRLNQVTNPARLDEPGQAQA
ncbi:hypothetical protein EPA93_23125 [Ktedonosporobacter rubrisoli]|uniref:Uncharacterized protein n=1 Tax=Ktedonosporobacter rubrisoli TaxID=2509675 RepID=A0A4P6JUU5_KTERU|nr:hypothetical protein [Ktedonosporobacter rubrisoli]QBD78716.1 hypothetical protein EPA93_23125 [Ktedonosporobacter rubrisoli]